MVTKEPVKGDDGERRSVVLSQPRSNGRTPGEGNVWNRGDPGGRADPGEILHGVLRIGGIGELSDSRETFLTR